MIQTKGRPIELASALTSLLYQSYRRWDLVLLSDDNPPWNNHAYTLNHIIPALRKEHGVYLMTGKDGGNIANLRNESIMDSPFQNELILRIDDDSIVHPRYVERLMKLMNRHKDAGAVGGTVPLIRMTHLELTPPNPFNELVFDDEGNLIKVADDGGYSYVNTKTDIPSHHLRSSFLMKREAWETVNGYPKEYGFTGFREETDFALKLAYSGYKMFTDTQAMAYHCPTGGGSKSKGNEEYQEAVRACDAHFREKVKYWYGLFGNPYNKKYSKMEEFKLWIKK